VKKIQERFANIRKMVSKNEKRRLEADGFVIPIKGKPRRKQKQVNISVVPVIPEEETADTMETHRQRLVDTFRKPGTQDLPQVKNLSEAEKR
jgi:hypothetical protein